MLIVEHARHESLHFTSPGLSSWYYAIILVAACGVGLLMFKRIRSWMFWETIFTVTLFLGVWFACLLLLPLVWALLVAAALTLAHLFIRSVFLHDAFYLVGAMGVAMSFATWLAPEVLLVFLVGFVLYDMVAGPPGGPIQELARSLVSKGIVPGLVVPSDWREFVASVDTAVKSHSALLGAGDLILPLAVVARAADAGVCQAAIVLVGLLVGVLILARTPSQHPRAALPALAAGVGVPFVVLMLVSWI